MLVTIKEIRQKIIDWKNDKITKKEIQEWGDNIRGDADLSNEEHFIGIEVISYLEFININLTKKEDIPYVLEYIDTAKRHGEKFENYSIEDEAYKKWDSYRKNINYRKRAEELKEDPFYTEYCLGVLKSYKKSLLKTKKKYKTYAI